MRPWLIPRDVLRWVLTGDRGMPRFWPVKSPE